MYLNTPETLAVLALANQHSPKSELILGTAGGTLVSKRCWACFRAMRRKHNTGSVILTVSCKI